MVRFGEARGRARQAVRRAKNEWFKRKAQEVERERLGGRKVWQCIRDMQCGQRGRLPTRVVKINDEDGRPCETTIDQQKRRRGHFSRVLTIHSQCNATEVARVKQK